jgi:hypothetical protein
MSKRSRHNHSNSPFRKSWLLLGMVAGLVVPGVGYSLEIPVYDGDDGTQDPNKGVCYSSSAKHCTLRAAIQLANTTNGPDIIRLHTNVTFSGTSGAFENLGKEGDLDITDDLTIEGIDSQREVSASGSNDRVFHIQNGATVTLKNLMITGGLINVTSSTNVPKDEIPGGGGILVQGDSTLTLESITLTNNDLIGSASFILTGGGLYVDALATVTIKNSLITNNDGPGGGGLTNLGHTEIRDTTISGNDASGSNGGGVRNMGGYLHIGNSTIDNNNAHLGAGIASSDLGLNLGNVIISNSVITSNRANQFGGGIHNEGPITLTNSTVSNNYSSYDGGGIYNAALGNMDIINSTISGNEGRSGGGIFNSREISLTNVTIYNNKSTPCSDCSSDIGSGNFSPNGSVGGNQIAVFKSGAGSSAGLTLTNTIIANGSNSSASTTACAGLTDYASLIHSTGGNLEAKTTGITLANDGHSCGLDTSRIIAPDIINSTNLGLDPNLAADTNFPGTTPVHALFLSSAAKDSANNNLCPQVDQRFLLRDGKCDIGAYEHGATKSQQDNMVDLKLTISDNVDPVKPNDTLMPLTYKITLTNLYVNAAARGVDLEIQLPTQFAFASITTTSTTTQPSCDDTPSAQGIINCFMDSLPGLGRAEVFVTGYPTVDGVTITTEAGVTSSTADAFIGNNRDTEETVVDKNASTTLNFGGTSRSGGGGGGGALHPWWLLTLGGLLLARRQHRR